MPRGQRGRIVLPDGVTALDMSKPRVRAALVGPSRPRLPLTEREKRVAQVVQLMANLQYHAGTSPDELAAEWGVGVAAVHKVTAEASRVVRAAVCDPDAVAQDIGAKLRSIVRDGSDRDAILAARVWAEVAGALAPKQVEIRHESSMTEPELRERMAALAARAKELAAAPDAEVLEEERNASDEA